MEDEGLDARTESEGVEETCAGVLELEREVDEGCAVREGVVEVARVGWEGEGGHGLEKGKKEKGRVLV